MKLAPGPAHRPGCRPSAFSGRKKAPKWPRRRNSENEGVLTKHKSGDLPSTCPGCGSFLGETRPLFKDAQAGGILGPEPAAGLGAALRLSATRRPGSPWAPCSLLA